MNGGHNNVNYKAKYKNHMKTCLMNALSVNETNTGGWFSRSSFFRVYFAFCLSIPAD